MSAAEPVKFTDGAAYERFMSPWSRSAGALFLDWLAPGPGLLSDAQRAELKRRLEARLPANASGAITVHASATAIKGRKAA